MSVELGQIAAGLPFAMSLAGAGGAGLIRQGRRRAVLNEALHELRRPLQALALALPPEAESNPAVASSLRLAAAALERLDGEINGGLAPPGRELVAARPLLDAAAERWRARARSAGGTLTVRWRAGGAAVLGSSVELSQALDNMIVNGLEHGGADVVLEGELRGRCLRLAVRDSGSSAPAPPRLSRRAGGRRGHGLRVVRRVAAAHGGAFSLRRTGGGTESVLILPLAPGGRG